MPAAPLAACMLTCHSGVAHLRPPVTGGDVGRETGHGPGLCGRKTGMTRLKD